MYKAFVLIVLVVIGSACATLSRSQPVKKLQPLRSPFPPSKVGLDLCPDCIQESVVVINTLLNLVLDEGIIQSCSLLCGALANRTDSKLIGDLCAVACEAFGIDEFVKALIKADLDPIYYCEILELCPINDHGDAKFIDFQIMPKSAPEGSTFFFDCSFISKNGTGTGTITLDLHDPKNRTAGQLFWFEARKPGTYPERISFPTLTAPGCDPSTGLCDGWPVGVYNVTARVCNGECGSQHPHTSTYDEAKGSFEITKKKF